MELQNDLMNAFTKGNCAKKEFYSQRLAEGATKAFYDPIKKLQLKTFSSLQKTAKVKTLNKTMSLKADKALFGRMAVIGQQCNIDLKTVFSYPLGPIPWSLAGMLGEMRKNQKASLLHELEKGVEPVDDISERYCYIYDTMAVVQKTSAQRTFGDFALDMFRNVLKVKGLCKHIDIVFDVYREISAKKCREK